MLNGNGKHGNGHKPHHIKNLKKVTKAGLKAAAVISNGSPTKMAKLLGIAPSTAHQHLKKPELNNLVSSEREKALKSSGLKLTKAYKRVDEALDAKAQSWGVETKAADHDIRLKAAKMTHEIYHPKESQGEEGGTKVVVNMPVVIFDGVPMQFKVGNNGHS